ncbi:MAG: hypothetical protein M3Q03_12805 [Chloroflexota bacterium]|nr:hypothetical protein [Chloroflexota bacterium]
MAPGASHSPARLVNLPELHVVLFAFLLNFVWEFWQVPFYQDLPSAPHWAAIKVCSLATVGDTAIALASFWVVAAVTRSRAWVRKPSVRQVLAFTLVGLVVTVSAEWGATRWLRWWTYTDQMPTLPWLGTGLLPLLQWMILPPLVVWFVQRQRT